MVEQIDDFGEVLASLVVVLEEDEDASEGVGDSFLLAVCLGAESKALTLREVDGEAEAARSYSSMRLARSSSEVIETKASMSSLGN